MASQSVIQFKKSKAMGENQIKSGVKDAHYESSSKRLKANDRSSIQIPPHQQQQQQQQESEDGGAVAAGGSSSPSSRPLPLPAHLTREALLNNSSGKAKTRRVSTRLQKLNSRANDPFTVLPDLVIENIIRMLPPQDNARIRAVCKLWKAQVEYSISPGFVGRMFKSRKGLESADRSDPKWAEKFYRKQSCCEELQRSGKATKVWKFTRAVAWALCGERMVWIDGTDICVQHLQPWNEAERIRTLQAVARDPNHVTKNKQLQSLLAELNRGPSARKLRPAFKGAHLCEPITVRFGLNDILKTRKAKVFINNVLGSKDGFLIVDYMQKHLGPNDDHTVTNNFMHYDYLSHTQFTNKLACIDVINGHAVWTTNIDGQVQRRLAFMSPGVYWSRSRYSTGYFLVAGDKFVSFTMYTEPGGTNNNNNTGNGQNNVGGNDNNNAAATAGAGIANVNVMNNIANQIMNMNHGFQLTQAIIGGTGIINHKRISLTVREIATGKVVAEETCEEQYPVGNGYFERPSNFFADPTGERVGAVLNKELFIYSVATAKCIKRVPLNHLTDEHTYQFDIMFSSDGTKLHLTEERLGSDFSSFTLDCENNFKIIKEDRYRTPSRINRSLKTVFSPRSQTAVFFRRNESRGEWHPEMAKFKPIEEILGPNVSKDIWGDQWKKKHADKETFGVDGPADGWKLTGSGAVPDFIPSMFGPTIQHPNIHIVQNPHWFTQFYGTPATLAAAAVAQANQGQLVAPLFPLQAAKELALKEVPRLEYACVTRRAVTLPPSKDTSGGSSSRKRKTTTTASRGGGGGGGGTAVRARGALVHRPPTDTRLPNGRREFWITWRWGPQSIKFSDQYLVFDQEDTIFVCDFGPIGW